MITTLIEYKNKPIEIRTADLLDITGQVRQILSIDHMSLDGIVSCDDSQSDNTS